MIRSIALISALSLMPAVADAASTSAERSQVGTLRCSVASGVGLIITSRKALSCNFDSTSRRGKDRYVGSITKLGLDIGATTGGELVWAVYRVGSAPRRGGLAGRYAGVGAEATAGVGLGANALAGGPGQSLSLQPFSATGQTGLNIAAGVAELVLEKMR
jgi:hypothetical protein